MSACNATPPTLSHVANCAVSLTHASRYQSVSVAFGASISRHNLNVKRRGEGAECRIDGLALIDGRSSPTPIPHRSRHAARREPPVAQVHRRWRRSRVFNRSIWCAWRERTNSSQSSRNLLLTAKARVDTKPQLEIFADDVKCAHGATVGGGSIR